MNPSVRIRVFPPRVEDAVAQCQNLVIGTLQPKHGQRPVEDVDSTAPSVVDQSLRARSIANS